MNAMAQIVGAPTPGSSAPAAQEFRLRRTGHKAVRFTGWKILDAQGSTHGTTMWYDLAIYRSDASQCIVELVARRQALAEQDLYRVDMFDSLDQALAWLETYNCAADIPVPPRLTASEEPMALAAIQAVQLRQRMARIHDDFQELISDVFEALDMTEGVPLGQAA